MVHNQVEKPYLFENDQVNFVHHWSIYSLIPRPAIATAIEVLLTNIDKNLPLVTGLIAIWN